jgi:hypothetical protein
MDLADVINREWIKRYGGDAVTDPAQLANRVMNLALDRDAWMANSKANQTEYLRLEKLLHGPPVLPTP